MRRSQTTTVSRWSVMPERRDRLVQRRAQLGQGGDDRLPDLDRVVFDPAGLGEVLGELAVGLAGGAALLVDRERADSGGAGIDGNHDGHGATLVIGDQRVHPDDVELGWVSLRRSRCRSRSGGGTGSGGSSGS